MSVHFAKRRARSRPEIPTATMSDIVCILLIFFMVTTELRQTSIQVRTILPQAEALTKLEQKRLVSHLYMGPLKLPDDGLGETAIQIDDALVEDLTTIRTILRHKLVAQPKLVVSLRIDESSELGLVMDVEQELREAGTLRINYSTKRQGSSP
jgi:biopolymer transport protein ExbD